MKKLISILLSACVLSGAGAVSAFEAVQSTDTNNVYIEGKLTSSSSAPITLRLYDGNQTCYIGEITAQKDGSYSTKFLYNGNASELSFDLRLDGEKINDTVIKAVSGTGRLVDADIYLTDDSGASLIIGGAPSRTPYTVGRFTYQPTNEIPKDTSVGMTIYPKNKLGSDNTKYSVLIAQYDESGMLVKCSTLKSDSLDFSDYSGKNAINCGKVELSENTASAKAFMWEAEASLTPYEAAADGQLEKTNLWLIGDSTWQNWKEQWYPQGGVGSFLGDYFNSDNITVINKAVSGSTAKSWLDDDPALGDWSKFIPLVQSGDYVIICLGINDLIGSQSEGKIDLYRNGIEEMVRQVKANNAVPILVSPVTNAYKSSDGKVQFSNYLKAASETLSAIAAEEELIYLPLSETSYEMFKDNDVDEQLKNYYMDYSVMKSEWGLTDEELEAHQNGGISSKTSDRLHPNVRGADKFASIVRQLLLQSDSKLKYYLK